MEYHESSMSLAQTKHLFYKLPCFTTLVFCGFVKKWGVVGGAPIVATIRIQEPSQKVWCLKANLEMEVFGQVRPSSWSMFFNLFVNILKFTGTNKHTNKQTSTQAIQRASNQRNTNLDICYLQCRLCFFGPMQWLQPLRGPPRKNK